MNLLYLAHPWLGPLLEHEDIQSGVFVEDGMMNITVTTKSMTIPRRFLNLNLSFPATVSMQTVLMDSDEHDGSFAILDSHWTLLVTLVLTGRRAVY